MHGCLIYDLYDNSLSPLYFTVSPGKLLPTATPILAPATSILTPASSAPTKPVTKPAFLALSFNKSKLSSQETNSPSSPNVTITPAEHPLSQYDSGKDSMTCSDASGHSNCSESLIKLDSPVYTQPSTKGTVSGMADYIAAEFDPLRTSISHDSLLTAASGPQGISSSPTPTPARYHNSQEGSYERGSAGQWMNTDTFQWGGSASSTSPKSKQQQSSMVQNLHVLSIMQHQIRQVHNMTHPVYFPDSRTCCYIDKDPISTSLRVCLYIATLSLVILECVATLSLRSYCEPNVECSCSMLLLLGTTQ